MVRSWSPGVLISSSTAKIGCYQIMDDHDGDKLGVLKSLSTSTAKKGCQQIMDDHDSDQLGVLKSLSTSTAKKGCHQIMVGHDGDQLESWSPNLLVLPRKAAIK